MLGIALGIIGGAVVSITLTMLIEYLRLPRLILEIEQPPHTANNPDKTTRRHLRLILKNKPLPPGFGWMQRSAATQCKGAITFHVIGDGQDVFGRSMEVRWASSPGPRRSQILNLDGNVQYKIQDFGRAGTGRVDVYPGDQEILDVAVRYEGETDCYGWNNEVYFNNWRNPDWRLEPERYLVKVVITSSSRKCTNVFRLLNNVPRHTDCRLEKASTEDRDDIRKWEIGA